MWPLFNTEINNIFIEPLSQFEVTSYPSNLFSFLLKYPSPELYINLTQVYDFLQFTAPSREIEGVLVRTNAQIFNYFNFSWFFIFYISFYIRLFWRLVFISTIDGPPGSMLLIKKDLLTNFFTVFNNINASFFLIIIFLSLFIYLLRNKSNIFILSTSWSFFIFEIYAFVLNILNSQVGKIAQKFFPYVFSIFIIILLSNVFGMFLFAFTLTSHIMVTFTLGVSSFIGLTILGFVIQKLSFFNLFLPKGIPGVLVPLLFVVELISYISRALSLSIRLFANLMSGHTLLHILAFFISKLCKFNYVVGFIGFLLILAIILLEISIGLLQAYVFAILLCIYLNDVLISSSH